MVLDAPGVIHPIFSECVQLTLDPYWKEIFTNFARNRFPAGLKYDALHQNLILRTNGKKEVIALSDKSTETFKIVMPLLREKMGMISERDLKHLRSEMDDQKHTIDLTCEWKKIKPKNVKDQLIMDYITRLKEQHSLTLLELKQLVATIQLGFQFHSLASDDVIYANGIVEGIEGLSFDEETRLFSVPEPPIQATRSEKTVRSNKFYNAVDKYVKDNALRIERLT